MRSDMASAFTQGAGVDPGRMKGVVLALVIGVIFFIAAWLVSKIIESYFDGELDKSEALKSCVFLCCTFLAVISFITFY